MSFDCRQDYFVRTVVIFLVIFPATCTSGIFDTVRNLFGNILERGREFTCNHVSCCESHLKSTEWSWMWYKDSPLYESLQSKLFGQHLVLEAVIRGITLHKTKPRNSLLLLRVIKDLENHVQDEIMHSQCGIWDDPKTKYEEIIFKEYEKRRALYAGALVILMFGPTGTGKSYASEIIAESLYKKGLSSPLVHHFAGKALMSIEKDQFRYWLDLLAWIHGNVTSCPYSMFIFDEFNELPLRLISAMMKSITSTLYRDAIFIFIMNTDHLNTMEKVLDLYEKGKIREDIKLEDLYEPGFRELFSYLEEKNKLDKCINEDKFMNDGPKNAAFAPFFTIREGACKGMHN